jgi:heme iron utilization protein
MTRQKSDAVALGRRLMRSCGQAALATSLDGAPYASLVAVAADLDASPLLLLSDLAQHSRNVAIDARVSLLLDGTAGYPDWLDGPRVSLLGRAEAVTGPRLLARFTARHPASARYAGFADFHIYKVVVERGHLVAGFGRIEWIAGADLIFAGDVAALASAESRLLTEINANDGEAAGLIARHIGRDAAGWRISGIDPEGIDLQHDRETVRVDFPNPVVTLEAAHAALAGLARKAR